MDDGASHEELRRRGLELQAARPEPSARAARWPGARRKTSEGGELVGGTVELALAGGLWAALLTVPALIIWLVRRLRRSTG